MKDYEVCCPNVETFNFIRTIGKKYGYELCYNDSEEHINRVYIRNLPINVVIHSNKK